MVMKVEEKRFALLMAARWKRSCLLMILLQFVYAGTDVVTKLSLGRGMSPYVLVVYTLTFSTCSTAPFAIFLERAFIRELTLAVLLKILAMALLGPVTDQILYCVGLKFTSPSFSCAMTNILPAMTFLVTMLCRKNKVDLKRRRFYAQVAGTLVTVAGAVVMTIYKGVLVISSGHTEAAMAEPPTAAVDSADWFVGSLFLIVAAVAWSAHFIIQESTLGKYQAPWLISFLENFLGTVVSFVLALFVERKTSSAWVIGFDINLFAAAFAGIFSSVIANYVQGLAIKYKGQEFASAFIPLRMIAAAVMGPFVLPEKIYLGGILGAVLIVVGHYSVLWGNYKESQAEEQLPTQQ